MLELTVKTLDSANHSFTLCDEATVLNLKESILEKLTVPVDMQRLIFHGKVLQDNKKLTEYGDVNGKVIHLVQRAPPSLSRPSDGPNNARSESANGSGARSRQRHVGFFTTPGRNQAATYVGSMTIPAITSFGTIGPDPDPDFLAAPPSQVMARNRLDCAKRMLGYARQSLRHMEDPSANPEPTSSTRQEQSSSQSSQGSSTIPLSSDSTSSSSQSTGTLSSGSSDESNLDQNFQAAMAAMSALQNARTFYGQDLPQDVAVEVVVGSDGNAMPPSSTPEAEVTDNGNDNRQRREEGARTDAMVPLLTELESINLDLQPFLARCRNILNADTSYDDDSSPSYQEAQRVFEGVSETLHSIAHACHSLSDLMVDFDEDAPRSLRCRPVILQHSTILETGFPVRMPTPAADAEVQVNVRRVDSRGNSTATNPSSDSQTGGAPPQQTPASEPQDSQNPTVGVQVGVPRLSQTRSRQDQTQTGSTQSNQSRDNGDQFPMGHGDFEILMDFDIDGNGRLNNLQGLVGRIHDTIMGSLENATPTIRVVAEPSGGREPTNSNQTPSENGREAEMPQQILPDATIFRIITGAGSNRQRQQSEASNRAADGNATATAGGETATPASDNGTESSRRTTGGSRRTGAGIRPPLHDMINSLFQGSFDPALPCHSHHIRNTRRRASPAQRLRIGVSDTNVASGAPSPRAVRAAILGPSRVVALTLPGRTATPAASAETGSSDSRPDAPVIPGLDILAGRAEAALRAATPNTSTAELFSRLLRQPHVEGQSIIADLIMILAHNVPLNDLLDWSFGHRPLGTIEVHLGQMQPVLAEFFTMRLLQGDEINAESLKLACDRVFSEMRPFIEAIPSTRLNESVDMEATISQYNSALLPELIKLIIQPDSTANFGSSLYRNLTVYVEKLFAIILHCCVDGPEGFYAIVRAWVRMVTDGIPEIVQQWGENLSVDSMQSFISHLNVPLEDIQGYIVYRLTSTKPEREAPSQEAMDTEGWVTPPSGEDKPEEAAAEALIAVETENLPNVIIGSEPWHNSLPSEWVPVIARDNQRQRRQGSQKPFSDAYLAGMPPKRRKLIASAKPPTDLPLSQVISDGVRHAIQAAGVSSSMAETAIQAAAAAGRDSAVQQAYKEQQRASTRSSVTRNQDFTANRFPNASNFLKKSS